MATDDILPQYETIIFATLATILQQTDCKYNNWQQFRRILQ